jgi:hypothetical protein
MIIFGWVSAVATVQERAPISLAIERRLKGSPSVFCIRFRNSSGLR